MIFAVSFLGALFAILASLLLVYTYVMLRMLPRLKKGFHEFVADVGPKAVFERANVDPQQLMRDLDIDVVHPSRRPDRPGRGSDQGTLRVIFTCEDHGRCAGCPKVLAQFEAIIEHQGVESFDEVEHKCYEKLRDRFAAETVDGEGEVEVERQRRIATRVVETLVREGFSSSTACGVVWGCNKDARETFAGWLSAAREGCQKLSPEIERTP